MRPPSGADWMKPVATFIPPFPVYPPEFSWMAVPETDIPAIYAGIRPDGGRTVHLTADLDRCLARGRLPDHDKLLAQAFHWLLEDRLPVRIEGPGTLDCRLYAQNDEQGRKRLILHLVNLTGCDGPPGSLAYVPPVGPMKISVRTDRFEKSGYSVPLTVETRVSGERISIVQEKEWMVCALNVIGDHELLVWQSDTRTKA